MTLTFPLTRPNFMDNLLVSQQTFRLRFSEQYTKLGSGQVIAKEMAPPYWITDISLVPMRQHKASEIDSFMESLQAGIERVQLYDVSKKFPANDPTGSIIGNSALAVTALGANNSSLRLGGFPNNYQITAGDYITVGHEDQVSLFRCVETVQAGVSGQTPIFDVRPHLSVGMSPGNVVFIKRAYARFVIVEYDPGINAGLDRTGMRFSAVSVPA